MHTLLRCLILSAALVVLGCDDPDPVPIDTMGGADSTTDGDTTTTTDSSSEVDTGGEDTSDVQSGCQPACGANATCNNGTCECSAGFEDCDSDAGNGCEADLASNDTCGACSNACGGNAFCDAGACQCDAGFDDCDIDASNGCEADLSTFEFCGGCTPHEGCTVFGTTTTCQPLDDTYYCPLGLCEFTYVDIDEDNQGTDPAATNGCEFGLVSEATWSVPAAAGAMYELELDGDRLYAAYTDANASDVVKIVTFDTTASTFEPVGATVDLQFPPGSNDRVRIAAHDGFVAITNDRGDVYVYETDTNGDLVKVRQETLVNVADIALVSPGIVTGSRAEFVAVGNGTRWYGIFDKGSEPSGPTCLTGDPGSTTSLCILGTSTEPASGTAITTMTAGGKLFVVAVGATTVELEPTATPALVEQSGLTGDAIGANTNRLLSTEDGMVIAAGPAGFDRFEYTEDSGNLTARAKTSSIAEQAVVSIAPVGARGLYIYGNTTGGRANVLSWPLARTEPIRDGETGGPIFDVVVSGSTYYMARGDAAVATGQFDVLPE